MLSGMFFCFQPTLLFRKFTDISCHVHTPIFRFITARCPPGCARTTRGCGWSTTAAHIFRWIRGLRIQMRSWRQSNHYCSYRSASLESPPRDGLWLSRRAGTNDLALLDVSSACFSSSAHALVQACPFSLHSTRPKSWNFRSLPDWRHLP